MAYVTLLIAALIMLPAVAQPLLDRYARGKPRDHWLARGSRTARGQYPMLLLMTGLLFFMIFESVALDPLITKALGFDFTPAMHSVEGDGAGWLQSIAQNSALDLYFYIAYMVLFVVLFYGSVAYFMMLDKGEIVKKLVLGYCLIYAVALPFFLFFPVNEVWTTNAAYASYNSANGLPAYSYTHVRGILFEMGESNLQASYSFSSINDCFPSLHTAISVYVSLVMLSRREKVWGALTLLACVSVVLATMYLGVHWLLDVGAGIALAVCAFTFVSKLDVVVDYPFKVRSVSVGRWKRSFGGGDGQG